MREWLGSVKPMTLKGQIAVPYKWWVGEIGSRFLNTLRNEEKIIGSRCDVCGNVYVPPRKNCGRCFVGMDQVVEVSCEGIVEAYSIVRFDHPVHPVKEPFAHALIKLDGADVGIVHLITENLEKLTNGVRVKANFKEKSQRSGHILDIKNFQII